MGAGFSVNVSVVVWEVLPTGPAKALSVGGTKVDAWCCAHVRTLKPR